MKLPIALVAAMAVQLAGAVWWVSQQAATISSLEENVEQFASRMAVENTVNLKRDVQESKSDIVELWEDSDSLAAHFKHPNYAKMVEVLGQVGVVESVNQAYLVEKGEPVYGPNGERKEAFFQD